MLTPGPDKLFWKYIKIIIQNDECLRNIINIANTCIDLELVFSFQDVLIHYYPKTK